MNKYKEMYESICRICLKYEKSKTKFCLLDNNSEDGLSCYGKSVLTFANISLNHNDSLPSFLCRKCLKLLKQAIYFKLECERSHKQLVEWLEVYKNNDAKGCTIEEVIVQNIMYSYYFPNECTSKNSNILKKEHTNEKKCIQINEHCLDIDTNLSEDNSEHIKQCKNKDSDDELFDTMETNITEEAYIPPINQEMYDQQKRIYKSQDSEQARKFLISQRTHKRKKVGCTLLNGSEKEKFICNYCNKDLANRNTLRYHMQRHEGCKYMCEHCGKGFPVLAELQLHQVALHGTGRYVECEHCSFKAPNKHILIEHERLHTGERPYTCDKCGLTFRRRAIWRKHMIYHTEKTVQCQQCPRKFFRRSEMLAHVNGMHERSHVYLCHKCDATYAKTASVRRHLTERHGIPREMQGKIIRVNKAKGVLFLVTVRCICIRQPDLIRPSLWHKLLCHFAGPIQLYTSYQ